MRESAQRSRSSSASPAGALDSSAARSPHPARLLGRAIPHARIPCKGLRRESAQRPLVGVRVEDVEEVGAPQLLEEQAHALADRLFGEAVAVPRLLGGEEVPAEGVRPVLVEHLPGLDRVAARLGHLLTLAVEDQAEAHHVAVGGGVEQQRGYREQRVEPAARLIERLADEVRGETRGVGGEAVGLRHQTLDAIHVPLPLLLFLSLLLALLGERDVVLGERHRAGVEPHVDHLGDASHRLTAWRPPAGRVRAGELDLIHVRAMVVGEWGTRELLQFRERADHMEVPGAAAPHRQRRAPVALARERPVDVVGEPVAEATMLDVRRVPCDGLIGREHPLAHLGGRDVPGGLGVVDQRRAAAPAVGVGVLVLFVLEQQSARVEVGDQLLRECRVLDRAALVGAAVVTAHALVVGAVGLDRVEEAFVGVAGVEPHLGGCRGSVEVVFAKRRCDVHEPCAVIGCDEASSDDRKAARSRGGAVGPLGKDWPLVLLADELAARELIEDLHILSEHPLDERFREDQRFAIVFRSHISLLWRDRDRHVARQCPRRRRPDQQRVTLLQRGIRIGSLGGHPDRTPRLLHEATGLLLRGEVHR